MTTRANPDWLKAFVATYDFIEPTDKLLFWSAVSSIAAAVRHNVIVDQVSYKLPLNHYIIFVGGAGIRKSAAILQMRNITGLVAKTVGIDYTAQSSSWQAIIDELQERMKLEMIYDIRGSLPHTYVTAVLSEFGSMFKSDDAGMVDFLVDLWDLHVSWAKHARKDGKKIELNRPAINIIGGTTPSWIADNFRRSLAKGGLGSRIIWVYETRVKKLVPFVDAATPPDYEKQVASLARDLVHIGSLKGIVTFTPDAREFMANWYTSAHAALLTREEDNIEAGFISRKQAHAFKLAAIVSVSQRDSLVVTLADMQLATSVIDSVIPDLAVIFKSFDVTRYGEHVATTEDRIEASGVNIGEQQLFSQLGRRLASRRQFDEAIGTLQMQGLIFLEGSPPGRTVTHVRNLTAKQWLTAKYTNCKYHIKGAKE